MDVICGRRTVPSLVHGDEVNARSQAVTLLSRMLSIHDPFTHLVEARQRISVCIRVKG